MELLQTAIEEAFESRAEITPRNVEAKLKESINQVLDMLNTGELRIAEKINDQWVTHQWIKKAVLLSFRMEDNAFIKGGFSNYLIKSHQNLQILVQKIFVMVDFALYRQQQLERVPSSQVMLY